MQVKTSSVFAFCGARPSSYMTFSTPCYFFVVLVIYQCAAVSLIILFISSSEAALFRLRAPHFLHSLAFGKFAEEQFGQYLIRISPQLEQISAPKLFASPHVGQITFNLILQFEHLISCSFTVLLHFGHSVRTI